MGGILAIFAAFLGGFVSAAGTAAGVAPTFGQLSGAACLQWQAWVMDRTEDRLTADEITSLTMLAVEGGTMISTETEAPVPGASPGVPKIKRTESRYFYVCDHTDEEQISQMVRDIRETMKDGSRPVTPPPSETPSSP